MRKEIGSGPSQLSFSFQVGETYLPEAAEYLIEEHKGRKKKGKEEGEGAGVSKRT